MPTSRRTIVIDRPIDVVFAFFTTPANDLRWRPHLKEVDESAVPQTGSRVRQVVAGPGGRGIEADIEVTGLTPPSRYAFQVVKGPARPRGEFLFASRGADATEVTLELAADFSGLKGLILSGSVQKAMDGETAALDTAKSLIESQ